MALVPRGSTKNPAGYAGASSPSSKGRMPQQHTAPSLEKDSGPDAKAHFPAPPVDGGLRGHDTNYPRHKPQQT